jgi:hypothetical protein
MRSGQFGSEGAPEDQGQSDITEGVGITSILN